MSRPDGRAWTHRVVKRLRGMQGEYFDLPTARTFSGPSAEQEARQYAEVFAAEQGAARIYGARICVRERRGDRTIAVYRSDDHMPQAVLS